MEQTRQGKGNSLSGTSASRDGERMAIEGDPGRAAAKRASGRQVRRSSRPGCNVRYANPKTHLSLGTAYLEAGILDDAVAEFEMARETAHCKVDAAVGLARCYLRRGTLEPALAVLEEALNGGYRLGSDVTRLHRQIALVRRYMQGNGTENIEEENLFEDLPDIVSEFEESFCSVAEIPGKGARPVPGETARKTESASEADSVSPTTVESVESLPADPGAEEVLYSALEPPPSPIEPPAAPPEVLRPARKPRSVRAKFVMRGPSDRMAKKPEGVPDSLRAPEGNAPTPLEPPPATLPDEKETSPVVKPTCPREFPAETPLSSSPAGLPEGRIPAAGLPETDAVPELPAMETVGKAPLLPEPAERIDEVFEALRTNATEVGDQEKPDEHYRLGVSYMETGIWNDACIEFRKAMKDEGRFFDCVLRIVRCRIQTGAFDEAVKELEEALSREDCPKEKAIALRYEMVRAAELSGDQERVERELERIDEVRRQGSEEAAPPKPEALAMEAAPVNKAVTWVFFAATFLALLGGWLKRHDEIVIAETGLGYAFGIIGALMMFVLLAYTARKRLPFMEKWGAIRHWYWLHMVLGTMGPALILFHANFRMGSVNSRVALLATLVVAGSGFIGRFIHTRVHYGLHGRRVNYEALKGDAERCRSGLVSLFSYAPKLREKLLSVENEVFRPVHGLPRAALRFVTVTLRARIVHVQVRFGLRRALRVTARRAGWPDVERKRQEQIARLQIASHLGAGVRIAAFTFWERLLALWNVLHLPLFILLILVAVIHVIAVHMF